MRTVKPDSFSERFIHQFLGVPYLLNVQFNEGKGHPVILLHGIAATSTSWDNIQKQIYPRFHAIGIDLLGFGSSPKPTHAAYTVEEHVSSVHRTIRSLKLEPPFILAGHSMGSLIAVHYAARFPAEVSHLVMLSPPVMTNYASGQSSRFTMSANAHARVYRYLREHKRFTLVGVQKIRQLLQGGVFTLTEEMWIPFVRSLEQTIEKQDMLDNDIKNLRCAVDIFYGEKDRMISTTNVKSLATFANITLHPVADARHSINPAYAKKVALFLDTLGAIVNG